MREPWSAVAELLGRHGTCAMVSVLALEGSGPREAGARMVVAPDGSFHGTIGGGTLEFEAIALARQCARAADDRLTLRGFSLGPDLGQCCGGRVTLAVESFSSARQNEVERIAAAARSGGLATRARIAADGTVGPREILSGDDAGGPALDLSGSLLFERFDAPATSLLLFGAGHVGRALVLALAPLPFRISWIDSRAEAFPGRAPANVVSIHHPDPPSTLSGGPEGWGLLPPGGAEVLIMTHDHAIDLAIADAALHQAGVRGVGMIGSRTKAARMRSRLRAAGHGEDALARFRCPIGIAGITSKEPAAIAVAVVGELMIRREAAATFHNKDDGRLAGGLRAV
ncbi:xanthine dehydrogenase accessory protein XdhC [Stappia sp.]|uniref:xanthine dehydrogenase accessory protein XdhC n=1 Tax=Stappia sp. TaxID=1870903 RepID=UPI003A9A640A